ncbi:ankyrin, partial [Guyanagaster necrorhizus]
MPPSHVIITPTKSTHQGDGNGGLSVTKQMRNILDQPGYLSFEMGGETLRVLYNDISSSFDRQELTYFGLCCYLGDYLRVVKLLNCQFMKSNLETPPPSKVQRRHTANPQHIDVLKYLISRGAPVDLPDITGCTALSHGAMNHMAKLDIARVLLESGSDPNQRNRYGEVPLLGCFQTNGIGAIDLLMEFGADIDIADADGVKPR